MTNKSMSRVRPTVVSGASIAMASGVFLIACRTQVMNKLGILYMVTIASQVVNCLVVMPAILYMLGP
jgi:predicted RND superfamily exporter protein